MTFNLKKMEESLAEKASKLTKLERKHSQKDKNFQNEMMMSASIFTDVTEAHAIIRLFQDQLKRISENDPYNTFIEDKDEVDELFSEANEVFENAKNIDASINTLISILPDEKKGKARLISEQIRNNMHISIEELSKLYHELKAVLMTRKLSFEL